MKCSLPAAVCISDVLFSAYVVMPWLEWCPDPQQPDAQWVKVFHPGTWIPHEEHDEPPPRHTYQEWKLRHRHVHSHDGVQPTGLAWYKRDWTTEGYRRVAAPEPEQDLASNLSPDHHRVAAQSSLLSMSPQVLEAILRSSDASPFSTEDLARLQAGINQQLADRMRQASTPHQPVRTAQDADQLQCEPDGLTQPYPPTDRPSSSNVTEKSIFEAVAE